MQPHGTPVQSKPYSKSGGKDKRVVNKVAVFGDLRQVGTVADCYQ
jgi:hypothetical protein